MAGHYWRAPRWLYGHLGYSDHQFLTKDIQAELGATLEEFVDRHLLFGGGDDCHSPDGLFCRLVIAKALSVVERRRFYLASLLCSIAWDMPSMIAFRALQGTTGGALIPMAFTLHYYHPA